MYILVQLRSATAATEYCIHDFCFVRLGTHLLFVYTAHQLCKSTRRVNLEVFHRRCIYLSKILTLTETISSFRYPYSVLRAPALFRSYRATSCYTDTTLRPVHAARVFQQASKPLRISQLSIQMCPNTMPTHYQSAN